MFCKVKNIACRGKQIPPPIECSNYTDEGGKKSLMVTQDSLYRELSETLYFFHYHRIFKKTFGPFNVVQLISLPKPEDKHHHNKGDVVVSYIIVYKDSIYLSQMPALSVPGSMLTELVHNSHL